MQLKLVKKIDEAKDTKSFFFSSNEKINFEAGQYAYITLGKITKHFTIASSPTEEFIQITTRIRESSVFKQNLDKLEIGSKIEARAPFGSFVFSYNLSPITYNLFLAGGIGITPFRSMIKYAIDNHLNTPIYLIYSNSDSEFVFKEELDTWQKENNNIKIEYIDTSVVDRIDKFKIESLIGSEAGYVNCMFWSVGSNPFVNTMEEILEELNIPEDKIKSEKFTGY